MPKLPPQIPVSSFEFLKRLKENNNRDWFNAHKDDFINQQTFIEDFADALLGAMNGHDLIEPPPGKKSLHRIYMDTRFSKDKTPYKTEWSGSFARSGKKRRGGYYFRIAPGNSLVAGGFWGPNTQDLKRVRDDLAYDAAPLRKILNSRSFTTTFGAMQGERLKTAPKGFDPGSASIDLLRYKQFLLIRSFTDEEVLSPSFLQMANEAYKNMRPFLDHMGTVLTTDMNGEDV